MANLPVAREKLNTIGAMLEQRKQMIAQVLPRHIKADRLIKVALMAMNRQPELLNCTPASLFQSLMMAGQLGLEPDGVLGSAYLIPYGTNCTLIPGYRGLIDLARRSGQIKSIEAHLVRQGDKFECAFGLDPQLSHTPAFPGDEAYLKNENIIGAYAVAKLVDGGEQFEVMSRAEIDAIRNRSKASKSGPWVTDFGEMARKTVVRRLFKYLPVSVEMASALELDNRADEGQNLVDLIDLPTEVIPQETKKTGTESLAEKTRGRKKAEEKEKDESGQSAVLQDNKPATATTETNSRDLRADQIKDMEEICRHMNLNPEIEVLLFTEDKKRRKFEDMTPAEFNACYNHILNKWTQKQDA